MLISRAWLQSFLPEVCPDDPRWEPQSLARTVTDLGLEVEGVQLHGSGLETVRVAEVQKVEPHPTADKLRIAEVFDGSVRRRVVCGAPNLPAPGGRVLLAGLGTRLPGGLVLEPREVRGVASEGMLCSEQELDIGPDADGIVVLEPTAPVGRSLPEFVPGVVDAVFELSVTPNRPDALGHIGIARDLSVKWGVPLVLPSTPARDLEADDRTPTDDRLVTLEAPDRCPRYLGAAFDGVRVGRSPLWLRLRLHRVGLRSLSNVVDVTNFVMMEWGHPLHAFDRDRLAEGRVVVRQAREAERFVALDGRVLALVSDDLVIADASEAHALAGVMGGLASSVQPGTTRILLEAAHFSPSPVRRTGSRHAMQSDSSHRFERGVDPGAGRMGAARRAMDLLQTLTGGVCVAHCEKAFGPLPRPRIRFRPPRAALVLGMGIPEAQCLRTLLGLGLEVDTTGRHEWSCVPPTHRPDLAREEDLIEEVLRFHGLEALPREVSRRATPSARPVRRTREQDDARRISDGLRIGGFAEVITLPWGDEASFLPLGTPPPERWVQIANPIRVQARTLRPHLLPGLLECAGRNVVRHTRPVRIFERGRVYAWGARGRRAGTELPAVEGDVDGVATRRIPEPAVLDVDLPIESTRMGVLIVRPRTSASTLTQAVGETVPHIPAAVAEVARALLTALEQLGLRAGTASLAELAAEHDSAAAPAWFHPGVCAALVLEVDDGIERGASRGAPHVVGQLGEIHPDLLRAHGLEGHSVAFGEIWQDALPQRSIAKFDEWPRFPGSARDLSLEVPVSVSARTLLGALRGAARELSDAERSSGGDPVRLTGGDRARTDIEIVEDYRGTGVAEGARALLFRLHYHAADRSVTDSEVQALHDAIVARARLELEGRGLAIRVR